MVHLCITNLDVPNIVTTNLHNQTAMQGVTINYTCIAEGFPAPNISWIIHQNDASHQILDSDNFYVQTQYNESHTISMLIMSRIRTNSTGEYTCNATNIVGWNTKSSYLTVQCKLLLL